MSRADLLGTNPELAIDHIRARSRKNARTAHDGRKLALIVEGGAMRGVFSSGANTALEKIGLTSAFDEVYSCSAGAINAAYFLAGQAAYGTTIYYEDINNRNFINPLRVNNILNLDFLFKTIISERKPLDVDRVLASPSRLFISITDAKTGSGFLIEGQNSAFPLLDCLRASATHPLLSERIMHLGDRACFDGGFANSLPVEDAIDNGCTDLLVVLTRPKEYIDTPHGFLISEWFRWKCALGNAQLVKAGREIHIRENRSRDVAFGRRAPPPGINIATICPEEEGSEVTRTTKNTELLKAAASEGERKVLRAFDIVARA